MNHKDQLDSLVRLLARVFDWSDPSYEHAVMHVENAVNNLRADLAALERNFDASIAAQDEVLTNKYNQAVKHAQELRAALEGYHKGADSIPYAQWSREQHAADIALKRTMP